MNRALAAVIAFALWSFLCGFIGYQLKDGRADAAIAQVETAQANTRADNAEQARTTDHKTSAQVAAVEVKHVANVRAHEVNFQSIDKAANTYANSHSLRGIGTDSGGNRGPADPEFVRIWNAANAGRFESPGPGHPAAPDSPGGRRGADAHDGR